MKLLQQEVKDLVVRNVGLQCQYCRSVLVEQAAYQGISIAGVWNHVGGRTYMIQFRFAFSHCLHFGWRGSQRIFFSRQFLARLGQRLVGGEWVFDRTGRLGQVAFEPCLPWFSPTRD